MLIRFGYTTKQAYCNLYNTLKLRINMFYVIHMVVFSQLMYSSVDFSVVNVVALTKNNEEKKIFLFLQFFICLLLIVLAEGALGITTFVFRAGVSISLICFDRPVITHLPISVNIIICKSEVSV